MLKCFRSGDGDVPFKMEYTKSRVLWSKDYDLLLSLSYIKPLACFKSLKGARFSGQFASCLIIFAWGAALSHTTPLVYIVLCAVYSGRESRSHSALWWRASTMRYSSSWKHWTRPLQRDKIDCWRTNRGAFSHYLWARVRDSPESQAKHNKECCLNVCVNTKIKVKSQGRKWIWLF